MKFENIFPPTGHFSKEKGYPHLFRLTGSPTPGITITFWQRYLIPSSTDDFRQYGKLIAAYKGGVEIFLQK